MKLIKIKCNDMSSDREIDCVNAFKISNLIKIGISRQSIVAR